MNLLEAPNRKGDKIFYYYDFGRGKGQRPTTGIFTYTKPKDQIQKNHNKQALALLEVKRSQLTIEQQAIGSVFIPQHKFKANFLDYYKEYVDNHKSEDNRHLPCSFEKFKLFVGKEFVPPTEITEDLCKRFRKYLLDCLTGETPQNYFARFKWVVNAATKDKYFHTNPAEDVSAIANPSIALKENLETDEYIRLLKTPCSNEDVQYAFIFCLYTGLRWVDVEAMQWSQLKENTLTTRLIQRKTGRPVVLTLHPIAQNILVKQRARQEAYGKLDDKVFTLPTANGANKVLAVWVKNTGIEKYITWSCARLSFSILLQDENVDAATVALLLGQTTTKQVNRVYKRHRPKNQKETINKLPSPIGLQTLFTCN